MTQVELCLYVSAPNAASGWRVLVPGQPVSPARRSCGNLALQVTVIDRRPLPGGLNTYGVAEYKVARY